MPKESGEQDRPDGTGPTVNRVVGDVAHAVQARDVGNVNIGVHSDHDVEVVLQPEQSEVVVGPGDRHGVVPLTVTSHLAEPVTVELSLRGAGTSPWTVEPGEVTVRPGASASAAIRLPCKATEPSAGPKDLHVMAKQRDGRRTWRSERPVRVRVRADPGLAVEPKVVPDVVEGRRTVAVTVRNTGNIRLAGSVKRRTAPEGAGYLPPAAVILPAEGGVPFEVDPGATAEVPVGLVVPPPEMTRKTWKLPLAAWIEGAEEPCAVPGLTVTQPGWLSSWSQAEHGPFRRSTLAVMIVVVLLFGLLLGAIFFSSSQPAAVSAPPPSQLAAPAPVPPRFAPVPREPMACTPGTAVVYLASMTKPEADEYAAYFVQRERSRMKALKLPAGQNHPIHVTDRAELCPVLREKLDRSPSMTEYVTFVWLDVPTSEAAGICKNLDRPHPFDCLAVPLT
ncbi:hypothetical protein [Amycolatopsis sp. NPDC004625]|uniref:COG1470 family protein n=1 Tax=Amycolatopsis sp. NPDC004625 TaxID=3154670 RepID=UPI0033B458DD